MKRSTSVPSLVSIIKRGPVSSGSATAAGVAGLTAGLLLLVDLADRFGAGFGVSDISAVGFSSVSLFVAVSSAFVEGDAEGRLRTGGAGLREIRVLGFAAGFLGSGSGDAVGVGSGDGASATSVRGSSIRAPTDETRLPVLLDVAATVAGCNASSCSASGPEVIGSKAPAKRIR